MELPGKRRYGSLLHRLAAPSAGEQVPVGTVVELELTDSVPDQTITAEKRYTANDAMVRSAEDQRYFILKTAGASMPSKYDLDSGETSVLDYITESLCCITLHFTDLGDAEVALFYRVTKRSSKRDLFE